MFKERGYLFMLACLLIISGVSAAYSIDLTGLQTEPYAVGEDVTFTVLVLEDGKQTTGEVEIEIYDIEERTLIQEVSQANAPVRIPLDIRYPSGLWTIKATAYNETVERVFTIKEKTSIDFAIEGDTLIIRNTGNIRYQKTVQITIGGTKQSKTLNIPVGEQKEWKLIAPEGVYDISVTDGENTFTKRNIQLFGTGNVIGAIDEGLVGYSGFGTTPVEDVEDQFISLDKLPITIVFVVVIFGLGILIGIEKVTRKR